jgi:hypothetical protein
MMNPIRNIEKAPGAGGPEFSVGKGLGGSDPARHKPHNYPAKRMGIGVHITIPHVPRAAGSIVHLGSLGPTKASMGKLMQEGGEVDDNSQDPGAPDAQDLREPDEDLSPADQQKKQIVIEAMAALRGQHPDPKKAIQQFIETFGEDQYRELRQMVLSQHDEPDADDEGGPPGGMQVGGLLHGPGSGQSDSIEAATPGGRKVLLSDGEYVIDAPTVAVLGDGSTHAGARRLDKFRDEVRRQAYGSDQQAKPMRKGGRAILEALNS